MPRLKPRPALIHVAIACGGTGGHLFPGLAVAEEILLRGGGVTLLISSKEVDRRAAGAAPGMEVVTLPAVGLTRGRLGAFLRGFWQSWRASQSLFRSRPHQAILAMGGFTAAPPVLAGRVCGAVTFLHESNTIPGRANRFLSWFVDQPFVGFSQAAARLHHQKVVVTGTPVRPQFQPGSPASARVALGLEAARPVLLVMGGSQGASGVNDLVLQALPNLVGLSPDLQFLHLTGPNDFEKVRAAYAAAKAKAVVREFLTEMELAMSAATLAVSRSGASSLAEIAAMRLPTVLIPYPHAADDHQFHNARAFVQGGAARMLHRSQATAQNLTQLVADVLRKSEERQRISEALGAWHTPDAAAQMAEAILRAVAVQGGAAPAAAARQNPDQAQRGAEAIVPARPVGRASRPSLS